MEPAHWRREAARAFRGGWRRIRSNEFKQSTAIDLRHRDETYCMQRLGYDMRVLLVSLGLFCGLAMQAEAALTVNADGTVSDSTTGLVWDRCTWGQTGADCSGGAAASFSSWGQALGVAVTANMASYKGSKGWRLPNRTELQSIVKFDASPSVDGTAFPNTPVIGVWYWTSTVYFSPVPNRVWIVNFYSGGSERDDPSHGGSYRVRLVRGGESYDGQSLPIAVTLNPPTGGVASCTPNPVNPGENSVCSATPNAGYSFALWTGDCSGPSCTLTNVTAPKSVIANFAPVTHAITVTANPPAGGAATCTPNPVNTGGSSTCSATPNAGYGFTGWSGDCSGATCTLANVVSARNVTANFALGSYTVSPVVTAGMGTIDCVPNPVSHGGTMVCTAHPGVGHSFGAWGGSCIGQVGPSCVLNNVTSQPNVSASFALDSHGGHPVPALAHWALWLLSGFLGVVGVLTRRRAS